VLLPTNRSLKQDIVIITEHTVHKFAYKNEGKPSYQLKIKQLKRNKYMCLLL